MGVLRFVIGHLVGDYLQRTDWQAAGKTGDPLGTDPVARLVLVDAALRSGATSVATGQPSEVIALFARAVIKAH